MTDTLRWVAPDGAQVVFDLPNYLLINQSGFGAPPIARATQRAPYQHGMTIVDTRLQAREITLTIRLFSTSRQGLFNQRRDLIKAFNPLRGLGQLQWEQEGKSYEIRAAPDEAPVFAEQEQLPTTVLAMISLVAPNPLWFNPDLTVESFRAFEDGQEWIAPDNLMLNAFFLYGFHHWIRSITNGPATVDEISPDVFLQGNGSWHADHADHLFMWQGFPTAPGEQWSARTSVRIDRNDDEVELIFNFWSEDGGTYMGGAFAGLSVVTGGDWATLEIPATTVPDGVTFIECQIGVWNADAYFDEVAMHRGTSSVTDEQALQTGGQEFQGADEVARPGEEFGEVSGLIEARNEGDIDAPVEIRFIGPATNPIAENEATGKRIQLLRTLIDGETVRIRTGFGSREAIITHDDGSEENVMHLLSPGSEFWQLKVGENTVGYHEESGVDLGTMELIFTNWFMGV